MLSGPQLTDRQTFVFSATLTVPVAARDNAKRANKAASKKKSTLGRLRSSCSSFYIVFIRPSKEAPHERKTEDDN